MNITRTTERMQDPEAPISPLGILGELENSLRLPHSEKGAVSLPIPPRRESSLTLSVA